MHFDAFWHVGSIEVENARYHLGTSARSMTASVFVAARDLEGKENAEGRTS